MSPEIISYSNIKQIKLSLSFANEFSIHQIVGIANKSEISNIWPLSVVNKDLIDFKMNILELINHCCKIFQMVNAHSFNTSWKLPDSYNLQF